MNILLMHNNHINQCTFSALVLFWVSIGCATAEENHLYPFAVRAVAKAHAVDIVVSATNASSRLDDNIQIQQWQDSEWRFVASPLWQCGTKETIFARELHAGEQSHLQWNLRLHNGCKMAGPGKYRVTVVDHAGVQLSNYVDFSLP